MGIEVLLGKTITNIEWDNWEIRFTTSDDKSYSMLHHQDCCESVYIEDISGNIEDLLHSPITMAEEVVSYNEHPEELEPYFILKKLLGEENEFDNESFTWTFYKLATIKGYVTIRWYGESNGYYSEGVDFIETN